MSKNDSKKKILIGLKKAHSSLERIIKVLQIAEEGKDDQCFDIIQQNLAVIGLLKSVNLVMLENHLEAQIKMVQKGKVSRRALARMKEEVIKVVKKAQGF